jgi:hypothetical protein
MVHKGKGERTEGRKRAQEGVRVPVHRAVEREHKAVDNAVLDRPSARLKTKEGKDAPRLLARLPLRTCVSEMKVVAGNKETHLAEALAQVEVDDNGAVFAAHLREKPVQHRLERDETSTRTLQTFSNMSAANCGSENSSASRSASPTLLLADIQIDLDERDAKMVCRALLERERWRSVRGSRCPPTSRGNR